MTRTESGWSSTLRDVECHVIGHSDTRVNGKWKDWTRVYAMILDLTLMPVELRKRTRCHEIHYKITQGTFEKAIHRGSQGT